MVRNDSRPAHAFARGPEIELTDRRSRDRALFSDFRTCSPDWHLAISTVAT